MGGRGEFGFNVCTAFGVDLHKNWHSGCWVFLIVSIFFTEEFQILDFCFERASNKNRDGSGSSNGEPSEIWKVMWPDY